MNTIAVLFGGCLSKEAFKEVFSGKSAFILTLQRAAALDGAGKIVLFARDDFDKQIALSGGVQVEIIKQPAWNTKKLFETLVNVSKGFDIIYYAWADTPLLDVQLAGAIKQRFIRYAAEYGYADGWPGGLAPELLLPSTAAFLLKLNGDAEDAVARDTIFGVLQKDINSFDIETEISPVDLRGYRLNFAADSARNLMLLRRVIDAGWTDYKCAQTLIVQKPEMLRTLPAFFPVMISGVCPQRCSFCPFAVRNILQEDFKNEFMNPEQFELLIKKIINFAGDGVIDISLWGEIALHPRKIDIISAVLKRAELSLVIETCGVGWSSSDIDTIVSMTREAPCRQNGMPALSWIVSLDSNDSVVYKELHGEGFQEAASFAQKIMPLFKDNVYVQAVRREGAEDDIEKFYKFWQDAGARVIIQKYDNFCGKLAGLRAGDISPVVRNVCWHIMRDMPIMLDGAVNICRETIVSEESFPLGNAFNEELESIWERGESFYREHCVQNYNALCKDCDEYYTYNF
jgi:spiro-SPASM protein